MRSAQLWGRHEVRKMSMERVAALRAVRPQSPTKCYSAVAVSNSAGMVISSTSKSSEWAISLCLIPGG